MHPAPVQPEGFYPGEYLKDTARKLFERDGEKWFDKPEAVWLAPARDFAITEMMALIRDDLAALGVGFDAFVSERELVRSGAVDAALVALTERSLVYEGVLEPPKGKLPDDWEARPQTLFRATRFGDEVDRPLKKSDGSWTYFAGDIAYHHDKFRRGFRNLIDVWGADHGGYVKRMQAAVKALSDGEAALDVKLCQLVHLFDKGEPVRMSKRAGTFVTLRDVIDQLDERIVEGAAEAHEPHRIAFFLQDVAAQFHLLWTKGKDEATLRFLVGGDPELTRARLALVRAVALVIASGLRVFGVDPVDEM